MQSASWHGEMADESQELTSFGTAWRLRAAEPVVAPAGFLLLAPG